MIWYILPYGAALGEVRLELGCRENTPAGALYKRRRFERPKIAFGPLVFESPGPRLNAGAPLTNVASTTRVLNSSVEDKSMRSERSRAKSTLRRADGDALTSQGPRSGDAEWLYRDSEVVWGEQAARSRDGARD